MPPPEKGLGKEGGRVSGFKISGACHHWTAGGWGLECEGSEAVLTAEAGADAGRRQRRQ